MTVPKLRLAIIGLLVAITVLPPAGNTQGRSLRVAITRDEGTLNPYTYQSGYPGWPLMTLVYDTLFYPDLDNVPRPWMVRDTKISADGKTWTLTLRPNLRWHDGRALTADDVKFTYEYVKKFPHSRWTPEVRDIESIETSSSQVVVLRLGAPNADFLVQPLADLPILPEHIWELVTDPAKFPNTVGSGPYGMAEMRPGEFYRLVANDRYFAGPPKVPELVFPIIRDSAVSFTALQAGEVDANARVLLPELVPTLARVPGLKVARGPGYASTLLQFNVEHPVLKDVRLRQAMANAINTTLMVKLLMLGFAEPGSPGYLHPASPWYNPNAKLIPSKSRAVSLLNEAGYRPRGDSGVREAPDGTPLRFTLLTRAGDPIRIRAAELIRTWLKDIGIAIEVRVLDDTAITDLVWPDFDVCKGRRYDMAIFGWSAPLMTRADALRDLYYSDCRLGTFNIGGYKNPEFDRLADELSAAVDPAIQKGIAFKLQDIVARDVPIHVLFYRDVLMAYWQTKYDQWAFQKGQGILNKLSFIAVPK